MARVVVQVDQDHLSGLLRGPRVGLAELVWNAVDADATVVDITVEVNDLGGVEAVSIADDGHGILADEVIQDFQALGGSWKKVQKLSRVERRRLHGQHGRGRFSAFGVGAGVRWRTVSAGAEAGQLIEIRGRADSLNEFDISEPVAVTEETGTTVHISQLSEASSKYLEKQAVADDLTTEFAIYLEEYPSIQIRWRGTPLAPSQLQDSRESYVLDVPEGQPQATLEVIEWKRSVDRRLHLCNEQGVSLAALQPGIHAPGFEFTAYVRWQGFDSHDAALADLGAEPQASIVDAAKDALRNHFKARAEDRRRSIISEWVAEGSYPYTTVPEHESPTERTGRQLFDVVAVTASSAVNTGDERSRRLSLRLIREALEANPASLHDVLQSVLELAPDRVDELGELLKNVSLASVIATSKRISDRLKFLTGLDAILFDTDSRKDLTERRQLHRILANETWIFGEEYALTGDDEPLTKVLKKYLAHLDDDTELAEAGPVLRHDGTNPIPDLVLTRTAEIAQDRVENLVVELKRPSATIGATELMQIEKYALAVTRDERFNRPNVTWDFWLIGNKLDEFAESRRKQTAMPHGYIQHTDRYRVQVRSWSEVLSDARHRHKFVERSLDYHANHDDGVEYLRRTHAQYLPASIGDDGESRNSAE